MKFANSTFKTRVGSPSKSDFEKLFLKPLQCRGLQYYISQIILYFSLTKRGLETTSKNTGPKEVEMTWGRRYNTQRGMTWRAVE